MNNSQIDIAIIGGGPAGLTAAIYARRAGWRTTVFEKMMTGGQMNTTPDIANYPGIDAIDGFALGHAMASQAKALDVDFVKHEVTALSLTSQGFELSTAVGVMSARSVIVATGAKRRHLGIPGEAAHVGRGVSYCAVCDGNFFAGRAVAVIGGGNTALEDALYLSKLCPVVYLVHRRHSFRGSQIHRRQVEASPAILPYMGYVPLAIEGEATVERLVLQSVDDSSTQTLDVAAVFVAVGSVADSEVLQGLVELDGQGRVAVDEDCATAVPGLFVAGDVRAKQLYQIVTATADGANAAAAAGAYLETALL